MEQVAWRIQGLYRADPQRVYEEIGTNSITPEKIVEKAKDPNSAITKTAIRRLLSNGTIPSINIGNKVIFNMDDLENILAEAV